MTGEEREADTMPTSLWEQLVHGGQDLMSGVDRSIAATIFDLAERSGRADLDWLFRPGRDDRRVRFGVVCCTEDSPRPRGEHVVTDSIHAVDTFRSCGMAGHVASQLVVSTVDGAVSWVALERQDDGPVFCFPSAETIRGDDAAVGRAVANWNRYLLSDSTEPTARPAADQDSIVAQLRASLAEEFGASAATADRPASRETIDAWSPADGRDAEDGLGDDVESAFEDGLDGGPGGGASTSRLDDPGLDDPGLDDPGLDDLDAGGVFDSDDEEDDLPDDPDAFDFGDLEPLDPAPVALVDGPVAALADASADGSADGPVEAATVGGAGASDAYDLEWVSRRLGRMETNVEEFSVRLRADVRRELQASQRAIDTAALDRHRRLADEMTALHGRLDELVVAVRRIARVVDPGAVRTDEK